ncbi:hypothetical protein BC835DRAFT_1423014 [Cytidiella melzeri]|nr:hypothetical protein BC835DRAFT_1423014 [Cytidiella melzeri]
MDTGFNLNFDTAVNFQPPDAWTTTNSTCDGEIDHFVTQVNASASFSFTGDRVQISTIGTNASGTVAVIVNSTSSGSATILYDLYSSYTNCGLQIDHLLSEEDTYDVALVLMGPSAMVNDSANPGAELHLTGIAFFVAGAAQTTTPASTPSSGIASDDTLPNSASSHTGAIVGGVLGGVFLLLLVFALHFIMRRRMTSKRMRKRDWALRMGRYTFDPTSPEHTVELSPRSAARNGHSTYAFDSAKLQPYARAQDHELPPIDRSAKPLTSNENGMPTLELTSHKSAGNPSGGMRSRSPVPKEGKSEA